MELTSCRFKHNEFLPKEFTCDDEDVSPPLEWTDPPYGTKCFVLVLDDPDAPTQEPWVHWLVYNIPADVRALPRGVPTDGTLEDESMQGTTSFRNVGYGGPCPPSGKAHRYFFKLYAVDEMLELYPGARKKDIEQLLEGHVLAEAELVGLYQR